MKKTCLWIVTISLVISMIAVFSLGCSAATTPAETSSAEEAPTEEAEEPEGEKTPLEEALSSGSMDPKDIKIVHYAPMVHEWWNLLKDGCDMFAAESGIDFPTVFGQEWTQDNANQNLQALVVDGYKGVATFAVDATSAPQTYKEMQAEGVYIVEIAGEIGSDIPSFVINQRIKGDAMAQTEKVIELMGEKGNIVHAMELMEDPHTLIRIEAVKEVVDKYPDVTLFQELGDCTSSEIATEKIGNLVMGNLDKIDGIVATGTAPTIGIANVMTELGEKSKDIKTCGIVLGKEAEKAIANGYMDACLDFSTMGMGYTSGVLLSHLIQGWTPNKFLVEVTEVMVTQDNIEEAKKLMEDAVHEMAEMAVRDNLTPPSK